MKPRQPVEARYSATRCQIQLEARVRSGKDEKRARGFSTSSHSNEKGFFIAPMSAERTKLLWTRTRLHEGAQVPRVRTRISADRDPRLRVRFRPARSGLRLRSHQEDR